MSTSTAAGLRRSDRSVSSTTVVAALGFLVLYLAVGFAQGALADRDLPLPDASAADTAAYYAANPLAAGVAAGLQVLSVACLALVVSALTATISQAGAGSATAIRIRRVGQISIVAMLASGALTAVILGVAGSGGSDRTAQVLRQLSFYSGGVAHVVTLGLFVFVSSLVLGRTGLLGKGSRSFGYVAGALAMLSLLSVAVYYANAFLPLGRVLCMVWTIVATIVVLRRVRNPR